MNYPYKCKCCKHRFDNEQKMNDPNPNCPKCDSGEVERQIGTTSFVMKGGFTASNGYS